MTAWMIANESSLRLTAFIGFGLLLWLIQWRRPLRGDGRDGRRLLRNLGLVFTGTLLVRLLFPLLAVAWAVMLERQGIGLFALLHWPPALEVLLAVCLLDLAIYWQHRLFHWSPLLWRLHRVHHSDTAFDVSTGVRFHPLEVALSMAIKLAVVTLLGAAPLAVLIFELLLSIGALFTHSDFALPARLDRQLRRVLVTPSMHRIHHSVIRVETDSNFGFHLSLWDHWFGSYRAQPQRPEQSMPIGLDEVRGPTAQRLGALLLQPFRSPAPPTENSDA